MTTETLPVDRATLIARLETLCTAACSGDTEAVTKIKQIKTAAAAGDPRAQIALDGLRHLYWRKQEDTVAWDAAAAVYRQSAKGDPKAKIVVKGIIASAQAGDPTARATWARLKTIHGSMRSGALFPAGPGAAKIGGHGMPAKNRAGVVVGGPTLVGAKRPIGSGPALVGGGHPLNGTMHLIPGKTARNYANRLVGCQVGGYGGYGGLGDDMKRRTDHRLVAGIPGGHETLVGGYGGYGGLGDDVKRRNDHRLVGGPSLIGAPVRAPNGLVVGRSYVAFGANLTALQIADLKTTMREAATARVSTYVASLGRTSPSSMTTAEMQAIQSSQKAMGARVVDARQRQSPALPNLINALGVLRTNNIKNGVFLGDPDVQSADDAGYRVLLTNAGEAVVMTKPILAQVRALLPNADQQRGFTMAMGARNGIVDADFPAFARRALSRSPDLVIGFDLGMGTDDPAYRVRLENAGNAVIASHPAFATARAKQPPGDRQRGFTMAMGVRNVTNTLPEYALFVRQSLLTHPELLAGFDAGMAS